MNNKHNNPEYLLYLRLKNSIGFDKSKQFMDWFHNEYPTKDPHHLWGSYGSIKTTDYTCVPVSRIEHSTMECEWQWAIDNLPLVFTTMIKYIKYLEKKVSENE